VRALLLLAVVACSTPKATEPDHVHVVGVGFQATLGGWGHKDATEIGRVVSRWTPDANSNKESISIIRTALPPRLHGATVDQLTELLQSAQGVLSEPSMHAPTAVHTKMNLQEVEIISDFVPAGLKSSYHRVHAVLIDGDALIHVLYTARSPDPNLTVFHQIVDSIHQEGQS
jgi:hypothetical protein